METTTSNNKKQKRTIPQNWKVGVASALGLVGGAGAVYAAEVISNDNVDVSTEEAAEQALATEEQAATEDVAVAEDQTAQPHPHHVVEVTHVEHRIHEHPAKPTEPTEPTEPTDPNQHGGHTPTGQDPHLPEFTIVEEQIVDTEDGGQAHVAFGFTEDGHLCAVIDGDMDGHGDVFFIDINDDQEIANTELVDLHEANIDVVMEDLPMAQIEEPPVEDDPTIDVGEPQTDDALIGQMEGGDKLPDYTEDGQANEDNLLSERDAADYEPEPAYEPEPEPMYDDTQNYLAEADSYEATEIMPDPIDVV